MIDLQDGDALRSMFPSNKKYYKEINAYIENEQAKTHKKIEEDFMLINYGKIPNEDYFEEYIDEDILQDIVNVGFDNWNEASSVDIFDGYNEYDDCAYFGFGRTDEEQEEQKRLAISKNNSYVYQLDKLLGSFRIYIENNIEAKTFAINNKYIVINLLHPYLSEHVANELYEISDIDLNVLMKYDNRVRSILNRFKNYMPSINIPNLASFHNQFASNDDEDIPF
ncbi:hypothetical protein SAMN05660462_01320 [Proteiniborus ethanoligenes]|uniref:Uncharacterized protein n=1 Tax=Proteiniborus ethanoligenes TaxID=415015 RepID=A0A1H3P0L1_9FIRM|nr:hypothetical protein [Proteiniborus ethanoligenes]SDY94666.1 hypothetical protein SAMN05660462_01320 [Proteiniborus ethanoligenes]